MTTQNSPLLRATAKDKLLVTDLLTQAFAANRSVNQAVLQDKKRLLRIQRLMQYSFDLCFKFGEIYLSENKKGTLLLLHRHLQKTSPLTLWWDLKLAFGAIGIFRLGKVLKKEALLKQLHPQQAFMYLWYVGVEPAHQGKGTGSALLQEALKLADEREQDVYLETSMEENLPLYKRLGFEIYHEAKLDFTLYCMKRAYRKTTAA